MVLLKKGDIEEQQSSLRVLRANTDQLSNNIDHLQRQVFTNRFMKTYTRYDSFDEFVDESPAERISSERFRSQEFNDFVANNTLFDDWVSMKDKAAEKWIVSQIDF